MGIVPKIKERNDPANLEKKNGTRNAGSKFRVLILAAGKCICNGFYYNIRGDIKTGQNGEHLKKNLKYIVKVWLIQKPVLLTSTSIINNFSE